MAPAAQYREALRTITATMRTQREDTMDTTNDAVKELLPPKTTDSYRSSSTFNRPSATPNVHATRHFPIPQIQGIVPGIRHALHIDAASPSFPHSLRPSHDAASTIPTTLPTSTPPSPRHSKYPRISPPGFLYPKKIVPPTAMSVRNSNPLQYPNFVPHNESRYHSDMMGRMDYELLYLPTGYKVLLVSTLATIILGVVWTLMVWAVNARMHMRSAMNEGKGTRKGRVRSTGEERRPIDKVSKYAHRHGNVMEIRAEAGTDMDSNSAVTSAAQVPFSYLGNNRHGHASEDIEMKYRPRYKTSRPNRPRSRPIHTQAQDRTCTSHRRVSSSSSPPPPPAGLHFNHPSTPILPAPHSQTPSTASSLVNPFLDPPPNNLLQPGTGRALVKRTSLEWKTGRAAFFAPKIASSSTPVSTSSASSRTNNDHGSEVFELGVSDIEALEAGTAPLTGRRHAQSESSCSSPGGGLIKKSKSWIDEGVGLVDGAVSAVAAHIGRWTDDDGGDESLLLRFARQGRGGDVSVG